MSCPDNPAGYPEPSTGCPPLERGGLLWPRIGLIADTHGLLRPEACALLVGCRMILHAGDIGKPSVLAGLREIAPVVAVRGNVDRGLWAEALPHRAVAEFYGVRVLLIHDPSGLSEDAGRAGYHVVVSGHSHRPSLSTRNGVLYINPGSAGPRRFKLPVSLALLVIVNGEPFASLHHLPIDQPARQCPESAKSIEF